MFFVSDNRAIGVFDSGLGGLTVVSELMRYLPEESIVYFGDTGRVPYGTRSRETIRRYALEDEAFLLKNDVKLIIAACGTVSSVASDTAENLPVPFFEVVSHAAYAAANATKNGKIGVLGTAATVKSAMHEKYIKNVLPDAKVTASASSLFVSLVEEGWIGDDDPVVLETAKRYLKPIVDDGADTVILGCTHFPVLKGAIKTVAGDNVSLIDAGDATATAVKEFLEKNSLSAEKGNAPQHKFFVSDKPHSFCNTATLLLGKKLRDEDIKQVDLNSL